MLEIEKDLVRWKRGKWLVATGLFFAAQVGALVLSSQKRVTSRAVYPDEPLVAMIPSQSSQGGELENPFLFAGASWNDFAADAWLRKPEWQAPETGVPVPMRFLSFAEAGKPDGSAAWNEPFAFLQRQRPAATLPGPRETPRRERKSELRVDGLEGRRLLNEPVLAAQVHGDVLSRTVVEALVGADGLVISGRILENSGSARADADAMALTRRTRFSPKPGTNQAPELGKLIFQWHALDLSQTNNVSTNVVR
jgi:TonB family protein